MKPCLHALALTIIISLPVVAQNSAATPQSTPPPGNTPQEPQSPPRRAPDSTKDQDAISGDQAAKPSEPKGRTTLIGCLSGPDSDGKFTLRSMTHRTGVQVFGPDNLKDDSGHKVKLTGSWVPGDQPAESAKEKESRRFQASEAELLAQKCEAPSEKTPVSKEKQQKKKSSVSVNADTNNPK